MEILLSKSTMPLVKYIAQLLGWLMTGIYEVLYKIGIPNIGLAIILYTIIVYVLMTPLQIKQQKSSKMMSIVQPEVNEIQKKYKGKKDQASQMKMQEEMQAVYKKYGVSTMGTCGTLLIQLPLLFALYQVIYHIPGYISRVADMYSELAGKIISMNNVEMITQFISDNKVSQVTSKITDTLTTKNVTDFLYSLKPAQWTAFSKLDAMSQYKSLILSTQTATQKVSSFGGIQISESPFDVIKEGFSSGSVLLIIAAVAVPVLAWFTQWLNYKLMPQQVTSANENDTTATTMKSMNTIMPLFSALMCITFSFGIGIYWIAGATIRCVQQVVINRRIAAMDPQELIRISQEKAAKKREKKGEPEPTINKVAHTNLKNVKNSHMNNDIKDVDYSQNAANAKPDSITARANMVKAYDEKKSKKK